VRSLSAVFCPRRRASCFARAPSARFAVIIRAPSVTIGYSSIEHQRDQQEARTHDHSAPLP
jgi:hypothetical protein